MVTFVAGIAVGAAFSKFWIALYDIAKSKFAGSATAAKVVADAAAVVKEAESKAK